MTTISSRIEQGQKQLWDPVRKQWVADTPEEEVRQHWIVYLLEQLKVPIPLIEVEWCLNNLGGSEKYNQKRVDLVVWKPGGTNMGGLTPWLLLECKAPHISLEKWESPIHSQIVRYLDKLPASFLVVSNGPRSLYWKRGVEKYESISGLPYYK